MLPVRISYDNGCGGATRFVQFLCSSLSHSLSLCSFEKCLVFSHPNSPVSVRHSVSSSRYINCTAEEGKGRFALMRTHVRFISCNQESYSISCRPCNPPSPSLSPPVFSAPPLPPLPSSPPPTFSRLGREEKCVGGGGEEGLRWSSAIAMLMPPLT